MRAIAASHGACGAMACSDSPARSGAESATQGHALNNILSLNTHLKQGNEH
ncbi:MAG: hypothetical protein MUF42_10215 [Cytophagaceae bacterium]|nr:hypothetical protein [Cytophagaceae bacterium]